MELTTSTNWSTMRTELASRRDNRARLHHETYAQLRSDGDIEITYHGHNIFTIHADDTFTLSWCNWVTKTTKERINALLRNGPQYTRFVTYGDGTPYVFKMGVFGVGDCVTESGWTGKLSRKDAEGVHAHIHCAATGKEVWTHEGLRYHSSELAPTGAVDAMTSAIISEQIG